MSVDVDRWLQDTLRNTNIAGWARPCNVYEDEHGFHIEVELPGVDRQDMNILFEDGVLTVKGERKQASSEQARRYLAQEIVWGGFSWSFRLPSYIDPDKVSASFKDGVLILDLPKRDEAKPRRIEISERRGSFLQAGM
jgi:HSP20 family protein